MASPSFPARDRFARGLGVAKAGYSAWLRRPPSAHAVAEAALLKRIRAVHASSRETYGAARVHAALRAGGERHSRKRVERLSLSRSVCEAAVGGATAGAKARRACLSYIEGVSNPVRLHSALSCRSPIIYEQEQTQTAQAEP